MVERRRGHGEGTIRVAGDGIGIHLHYRCALGTPQRVSPVPEGIAKGRTSTHCGSMISAIHALRCALHEGSTHVW